MSLSTLTERKVGGVPVVYLAAGGVVVLTVVAVKMKTPSSPPADTSTTPAAGGDLAAAGPVGGGSGGGEAYPNMPTGTVIVAPSPAPVPDASNSTITDNDQWLRKGVTFLIGRGVNPGSAQAALTLYLSGANLTYEQGQMRDDTVREYGIPPYASGDLGTTGANPKVATDAARAVIVNAYQSDLGRAPSEGEITAWTNRPGDDAAGIHGSPEAIRRRSTVAVPVLPRPVTKPVPVVPKSAPKPAPPAMQPKFPGTLRNGSQGANVQTVQRRLGINADGKFGPGTVAAVKRLQTSKRLAADGVVGPLTWKAMF